MAGRRICAGYYRRYDGKVIYVVSLATDSDNGEEVVIWTTYPFADVPQYYTSSKKSFCAFVEVSGERRAKYKRLTNMKISEAATYHAYAKELCENYNFDLRKYRFCVNQKRYAAITKSDFGKLKEDLCFLDNALKTVLADYRDYFRERFVDGLSIRKYASAHLLNRGRVDYLQKKFLSALARLLKERDEAEGKCRLRQTVKN